MDARVVAAERVGEFAAVDAVAVQYEAVGALVQVRDHDVRAEHAHLAGERRAPAGGAGQGDRCGRGAARLEVDESVERLAPGEAARLGPSSEASFVTVWTGTATVPGLGVAAAQRGDAVAGRGRGVPGQRRAERDGGGRCDDEQVDESAW
ncbi:MAG: hypothetical protein ABR583_00845 [Gaiellaceae bacterium]